jgi:hypothetical protein
VLRVVVGRHSLELVSVRSGTRYRPHQNGLNEEKADDDSEGFDRSHSHFPFKEWLKPDNNYTTISYKSQVF